MAKAQKNGPQVLTANDLLSGAIVYWTGHEWSTLRAHAVLAQSEAARERLAEAGKSEEANNIVVGAYLMTVDPATGEPVLLRERQRLAGPSIPLPTAH